MEGLTNCEEYVSVYSRGVCTQTTVVISVERVVSYPTICYNPRASSAHFFFFCTVGIYAKFNFNLTMTQLLELMWVEAEQGRYHRGVGPEMESLYVQLL